MNELLSEIAGGAPVKDAYDKLPLSIQCMYSRREWMWMSDAQKADLVTNECQPDTYPD